MESSSAMSVHPLLVQSMPSLNWESVTNPKPLIGLLFAASWCPDCTDVVPAIGRVVGSSDDGAITGQGLVDIIYVGSETDEESLLQFKPTGLRHIPIAAEQERSNLKRTYQTCAGKEMSALGMTTRKNGIPTLILLDATTGQVLSENGVDDVMKASSPKDALNVWKQLLTSAGAQ